MSFSPAALFNSYFLTVLKRETGESPVRSRHCKPGAHDLSLELGEQSLIGFPVGKAVMREERQARKPAGCWYGNSKDTGQRCFWDGMFQDALISDSDGKQ